MLRYALVVVDAQERLHDPAGGKRNNLAREDNIASLVERRHARGRSYTTGTTSPTRHRHCIRTPRETA